LRAPLSLDGFAPRPEIGIRGVYAMSSLRRLVLGALVATTFSAQGQVRLNAAAECETLTRAALAMAVELLRTQGEFNAFGVGQTESSEVLTVDAAVGPTPGHGEKLQARLAEALQSGRLRVTALVYELSAADLTGGPRSDDIAILLQRRDHDPALLVYPYVFDKGEVRLGQPKVVEGPTSHVDRSVRLSQKPRPAGLVVERKACV
jgi:hypothetical protein